MQTVSTDAVRELREQQVPIIDVLPNNSYVRKHISGSFNVPVGRDDFVESVERLVGGKHRPVVVYCASQTCNASPKAASRLERAGFERVSDYEGGIEAWEDSGLSIVGSDA